MSAFLGLGGIGASMGMGFLMCFLPVIWFYTFFDTFLMARLEIEERKDLDCEFITALSKILNGSGIRFWGKRKKVLGGLCIFLAVYALIYGFILPILSEIDWMIDTWMIHRIVSVVPTLIVVVFLAWMGGHLLRSGDKGEFSEFILEEEKEKIQDE